MRRVRQPAYIGRGLRSAFVVALLLVPSMARAEQRFGLEFAANFNKPALGGTDAQGDISDARKVGVLLGGFATLRLAGPISLQAEVLYAQKRFEVKDSGEYTATEKWDFIEVPLLLRIDFQENLYRASTPGAFILFGPGFSTRASLAETDLKPEQSYRRVPVDLNQVIRSSDVDVIAAIGITMGRRFEMEARYDRGLRNLNTVPGLDPEDPDLSIKEQSFAIVAHWTFR